MTAVLKTLRRTFLASIVLTAGLVGAPAGAQSQMGFGIAADPTAPIEMISDRLEVSQTDGNAIFQGNVRVSQNEMRLSADRVEVVYDQEGEEISRLDASGSVVLVSGADSAEANKASYDVTGGTILMQGQVMLLRGNAAITSERMNVNLTSGTAQLEGQVRTVLRGNDN